MKSAVFLLCATLVLPVPSVFAQEASGTVQPAGKTEAAPKAKSKSKKKAKGQSKAKKKEAESSQYRFPNALSDGEPKTYRFDANGNPIPPPSKKKKTTKKKKKKGADEEKDEKSEDENDEKSEDKPEDKSDEKPGEKSEEGKDGSAAKACTTGQACSAVVRD